MRCAANYAWANRQMITHLVRSSLEQALGQELGDTNLQLVYDVCHNIAKVEEHQVDGHKLKLCVHRKGATRAFGPGQSEVPADYRRIGQPVLIPGNMQSGSYVLVGTEAAMQATFGSTAHGAGRVMSRTRARKSVRGEKLRSELESQQSVVRAGSLAGLAEEAPLAYKDLDHVVRIVHASGIARQVARTRPLGVIKG
jgi:tRNA-splicing ligase RtcB